MKKNSSAGNQILLSHGSLSFLDETNKIKLETTNEFLLNNKNSPCTNTGVSLSHYVKSFKEIIKGRIYAARTGNCCFCLDTAKIIFSNFKKLILKIKF